MKINANLFVPDKGVTINAIVTDKHIIPLDKDNRFLTGDAYKFEYEIGQHIQTLSTGRFNTIFKYGDKQQWSVYSNLTFLQRTKLKAMFGDTHVQKHWKWYLGAVPTSIISYLFAVRMEEITMLWQWLIGK